MLHVSLKVINSSTKVFIVFHTYSLLINLLCQSFVTSHKENKYVSYRKSVILLCPGVLQCGTNYKFLNFCLREI